MVEDHPGVVEKEARRFRLDEIAISFQFDFPPLQHLDRFSWEVGRTFAVFVDQRLRYPEEACGHVVMHLRLHSSPCRCAAREGGHHRRHHEFLGRRDGLFRTKTRQRRIPTWLRNLPEITAGSGHRPIHDTHRAGSKETACRPPSGTRSACRYAMRRRNALGRFALRSGRLPWSLLRVERQVAQIF
jgi:hypothetical protein